VRTDRLDAAVWEQVRTLLAQPDRLAEEYQRRLAQPAEGPQARDQAALEGQAGKLRAGIGRLIDAYAEGVIERSEFEPRVSRLKERLARLEGQIRDLAAQAAQQRDLALVIGQLEAFATAVRQRLDDVDWETQRTIIRALVKRVEIDREEVHVVFRINPATLPPPSNDPGSHYCWGRDLPLARQYRAARDGRRAWRPLRQARRGALCR
jgi:site-specific DNA recombinase